jgi:glyceraldehyde-3-phosphate dehydrogenase/erythrose-4-phosphate dehydrogenase
MQQDMELVGVADVVSDWRIRIARAKGYPVYAAIPEASSAMRTAGVPIAMVAAHTSSHLHAWSVELTRPASKEEVLAAFRAAPRIAFLRMADGIVALNSTHELRSDLARPRGDMWEVGLWEDGPDDERQ